MRALFALFIRSLREDLRARLPPILRAALVLLILLIVGANQRKFAWSGAPGREFLGMLMMLNLQECRRLRCTCGIQSNGQT